MIETLKIKNFKSILEQEFRFAPLTILAGTNSSGKSSVIQAILACCCHNGEDVYLRGYLNKLGNNKELINKNATEGFEIDLKGNGRSIKFDSNDHAHPSPAGSALSPKEIVAAAIDRANALKKAKSKENAPLMPMLIEDIVAYIEVTKNGVLSISLDYLFEEKLFFLCANRVGQENLASLSERRICGVYGEYIFGTYERLKNEAICNEKLIDDEAPHSLSLSTQVNYWLNKILDLRLNLQTEQIDSTNVKVFYKNNDLEGQEISPMNLGAGVSYLAKILILGLLQGLKFWFARNKEDTDNNAQSGTILIIENPEIHLHPRAVSKLADFFVLLANAGIQVILETHSEHILNKIRWSVFKGKISPEHARIYYRGQEQEKFLALSVNQRGKYTDENGEVVRFPSGFFDSDLDELMEMA